MSNCKKFKDQILTDYVDEALAAQDLQKLNQHLRSCADCMSFAAELKSRVAPLQDVKRMQVPHDLWTSIEAEILQKRPAPGFLFGLQEWIKALSFPKLVPVLGTLVMFLLIGSVVMMNQRSQQIKNTEGGAYLASVLRPLQDSEMDTAYAQTPIERYFL